MFYLFKNVKLHYKFKNLQDQVKLKKCQQLKNSLCTNIQCIFEVTYPCYEFSQNKKNYKKFRIRFLLILSLYSKYPTSCKTHL